MTCVVFILLFFCYLTVQDNAEQAVKEMLLQVSLKHKLAPVDTLRAQDYLDDGTPINLAITIDREKATAKFDFAGTGSQIYGKSFQYV